MILFSFTKGRLIFHLSISYNVVYQGIFQNFINLTTPYWNKSLSGAKGTAFKHRTHHFEITHTMKTLIKFGLWLVIALAILIFGGFTYISFGLPNVGPAP